MSEVKAQSLPDLYGQAMFVQVCQKDQGDKILSNEIFDPRKKIELLQLRSKACDCFYNKAKQGGVTQEQMLKIVSQMQHPGEASEMKDDPLMVKMVNDPRFGGACGLIPFQP
ncbi:MAG: hypothetical protein AB7E85_07200 [Pseudobdellovibrionaceae bacterium]